MSLLFFSLALLTFQDQSYIDKVREGYLDHNDLGRVGLVFEHYRYFEKYHWKEVAHEQVTAQVIFEGIIDDKPAVTDFYNDNKYAFHRAFKAMQLEPYYGLGKDKTKLRYRIVFTFNGSGGFSVTAGELGQKTAEGKWVDKKLEPKSLLAVLEGIYSNENPYVSLVDGLPFK